MSQRVLILASTTAYQTGDLIAAARTVGAEPIVAQDRCHMLADTWTEPALAIDFRDPDHAVGQLVELAGRTPVHGVVATDEVTSVIAAGVADALGLRRAPMHAARRAADKRQLRQCLAEADVAQPRFELIRRGDDVQAAARAIGFPVVIKPLCLSGSRGVMRADDARDLAGKVARLNALLDDPEVAARAVETDAAEWILVEQFVAGAELAYEGLIEDGDLRCLALFDKPDPLDGPYFAETLYITPSRQDEDVQGAVHQLVARAAGALGIDNGPIHAEIRVGEQPVLLELAARSIGGLCGRVLQFGAGISLAEVVIAHALGVPLSHARAGPRSGGVYMLPVAEAGVLGTIEGVELARVVPGIRDIVITARPGDVLVPLPEGRSYLGFVFADGDSPALVEEALRRAHRELRFTVRKRLSDA